jgi:hypothetical protein
MSIIDTGFLGYATVAWNCAEVSKRIYSIVVPARIMQRSEIAFDTGDGHQKCVFAVFFVFLCVVMKSGHSRDHDAWPNLSYCYVFISVRLSPVTSRPHLLVQRFYQFSAVLYQLSFPDQCCHSYEPNSRQFRFFACCGRAPQWSGTAR